jgi:hypothetical protein
MLKVAGVGWLAAAAHHVYLAQVRLVLAVSAVST